MSDPKDSTDELAGSEQPFVQHLMELRDRLLYGIIGLAICMALLAFWPGPSGLIDLIAVDQSAYAGERATGDAEHQASPSVARMMRVMAAV